MKKSQRKKIFTVTILMILIMGVLIGTQSWATFPISQSQQDIFQPEGNNLSALSNQNNKVKTHAPEPSTLALFGSGLIGVMMTFIRRTYAITKRIFDLVVAVLALIVLIPICVLLAILIKLTSPGTVLFNQVRVGKDGRIFNMYKFRTMKVDAEKETGPVWAAANDKRLIPVGEFLRKAHLDEIPQFINVIKGEMSIIGPRPERPIFVDKFSTLIGDYEKRLAVKPGITGLAQVWHKYDETMEDVRKKVKYDLLYIRKLCLWTDLRILFRTVRVIFTGEGAR